ncbi:class I SAM-dependent methyltransferase [Cohnella lubricantis]|uniref:Class I SAM-dependent methyltransferase n=1 Tax=Cohnella lubricantis TaxID=2163172 RepID=A0A841TAE3_9BACL|nr:class I SAM-dependent methyltransferase [Cohnella lubricantis]MBB6677036.1 class I SAM-dependent methyltransferase [Cohnella lubricantis]MBP2119294.1 SAM-dependent methyltransferase [Cohnella lubricantis]
MDSKRRFSNRVDTYVKYRPDYPREAIDYLFGTVGLRAGCEAADVGAGTGIFSRLLLERGCRVTAVEPNAEMRAAAVERLGGNPGFRAVSGSAEATGLPDGAADFIVCAQSFHWFDRDAARMEFQRVLRPGGKVALIWNTRLTEGTPFREEYDKLLRDFGTDYEATKHTNIRPDDLAPFFKSGRVQEGRFPNRQLFDYEGLRGRLLSSSYIPVAGAPGHDRMLEELRGIFDRNQADGKVPFEYVTQVFWGEV